MSETDTYRAEAGYWERIARQQTDELSKVTSELEECRRLLREICDQQKNNHTWLGTVAGQEWLEAAKAAGGE